ncbi:hypothetical protein L1787_05605 [Acuticoccus sp. M5D2P5]|uniref:hypothetical protein n=1 Tax=Acuticoccus kalidii TaxID=2910977 RepID=UPI001F2390F5|nr:hypothetical protein [Acuticoccus kalidii]MCF3932889.1 hypothetical protein [Acuticoccus kalidii]
MTPRANRDRARQAGARNRHLAALLIRALKEYAEGRPAKEILDDLAREAQR